MKQVLVLAVVLLLLGAAAFFVLKMNGAQNTPETQETPETPEEQKALAAFKAFIAMGDGIYSIKYDEDGNIKSLIIVGHGLINPLLDAQKGKEQALARAERQCVKTFAKWCKMNLSTDKDSTDTENTEAPNVDMEKITRFIEENAQTLYFEVDEENKGLMLVKGLKMPEKNKDEEPAK